MTGRFWRRAPWWIAGGAAALALSICNSVSRVSANARGRGDRLGWGACGTFGRRHVAGNCGVAVSRRCRAARRDARALLYRAARSQSLGFDGSLRSMLLFGFFVSAAGSALFSVMVVEARPLQWFVWTATMGAPLLPLLGGGFLRLPHQFAPLLSRFLVFVLWLQVPVVAAQYARLAEVQTGDWYSGTWANPANLVGLWGAVVLVGLRVRLLTATTTLKGMRTWIVAGGHVLAAGYLVWGGEAKLLFRGDVRGCRLSDRDAFYRRYRDPRTATMLQIGCGDRRDFVDGSVGRIVGDDLRRSILLKFGDFRKAGIANARGFRCRSNAIILFSAWDPECWARAPRVLRLVTCSIKQTESALCKLAEACSEARALGHVRFVGRRGGGGRYK